MTEARRCFANQGFEGTSLNDIAAGVGIRRPSLLHYFESKEALYRQILEDALAEWGLRIDAIRSSELDGWPLVEEILEATFDFFRATSQEDRVRDALRDEGLRVLSRRAISTWVSLVLTAAVPARKR